jgi:hypothetical protein
MESIQRLGWTPQKALMMGHHHLALLIACDDSC